MDLSIPNKKTPVGDRSLSVVTEIHYEPLPGSDFDRNHRVPTVLYAEQAQYHGLQAVDTRRHSITIHRIHHYWIFHNI